MSRNKLLYASGALAGGIYFLLILLIALQINQSRQKKLTAKPTPTYSSVNIDLLSIQPPPPKEEVKKEEPPTKTLPKIKKAEIPKPKAAPKNQDGLRKLFSDIPNLKEKQPNKIKQEELAQLEARRKIEDAQRKAEEEYRRIQEENEKLLKKSREVIKALQSKIQNASSQLETIRPDIELKTPIPIEDKDGIYDEWLNEIYKILYKNSKTFYQKNATITVIATIDTKGKFSYRVIRYSSIPSYDSQIINLLDNLTKTKMPPYPKKKSISIEVNFKSKTT